MKWKWRNDRRSERNLCNCVKKPEKNSGFNGVWARDLAIPVRCSTNWAMKPLTLGAGLNWPALNVSIFKVSKVSQWTSGWGIQSMTWRLLWPVTMPPGQIPGDLRFFFLSWWSIPHPQVRRRRQFPTPELLIDLTYVFLEYIFFRAIVISVP